ncbi:MAG: bifunctional hydroxymethylpyrimidine kinase/phosphomethylpyrimidine kinase [Verrucomicrobia bacterium]|nr:bifunctional hydroxymethylpyrimidine kinase/phosphomethylpyrimidine kinase [Verrucomicrobiota bacterium]
MSGSDASGAAGLQADNRAIHAAGAFPLNVVTALTLQTEHGVESIDLTPPELVRMHLIGLLNTYPVSIIKAGMLGNASIVNVLAETLEQYPSVLLVLDPVIQATSGRPLLNEEGVAALLKNVIPRTFLVTPNLSELEVLAGRKDILNDPFERVAANDLLKTGCSAVLVKGGHRPEGPCLDRLYLSNDLIEFSSNRVSTRNTRGTGCALASLIAGGLAKGLNLENSIMTSKQLLTSSLEALAEFEWPGSGPAFL